MAIVDKMELGRELFRTLTAINQQTDTIKMEAINQDKDPTKLRDNNGGFVLVPLLAARAQCLHALAIINQKD